MALMSLDLTFYFQKEFMVNQAGIMGLHLNGNLLNVPLSSVLNLKKYYNGIYCT